MSFAEIGHLWPFALALLATGAVAGTLAGLLGVGGGIVIVPVLFNLLPVLGVRPELVMHIAVATSLATIIPTSLMSARSHHLRGSLDWELFKGWGVPLFIGVLLGTLIGAHAKGVGLTILFASIALLVAARMAFQRENAVLAQNPPVGAVRAVVGLLVGGISVLMGIGAGTLCVPIMSACNIPIRRAVGTAAALGFVISLPGSIGFMVSGLGVEGLPAGNIGYTNLLGFALIVPMTLLMAPVGAKIAHSISPAMLQKAFAFFLFATSLRMFWSVL